MKYKEAYFTAYTTPFSTYYDRQKYATWTQ
ncbi:hypothetical protein OA39_01949 [Vibrio campbellii]|nr:hypothetical protein OA39_01949 [Vibrio campbellii]